MVEKSREMGLKLSVRLPCRWTESFRQIKRARDAGQLGEFVSGYVLFFTPLRAFGA
mgnify:CR=1 FL=1